jgi:hypothetical protein
LRRRSSINLGACSRTRGRRRIDEQGGPRKNVLAMKWACALVVVGLILFAVASASAGQWYLMLAPLDVVKQLGERPMAPDEYIVALLEQSPLSEWNADKAFGSVESCEFEIRARIAANIAAGRDLARQIDRAKERGDSRMLEIADALRPYRIRDSAALCVVTNEPRQGVRR